jgi:hypothetical protein
MTRRHQIDVMTTTSLKLEHHSCQLLGANLAPRSHVAYVVVLAEATAEVAPAEEDRPRSSSPNERALLPEVGVIAADDGSFSRAAGALLSFTPVDSTLPGTQIAIIKTLIRQQDTLAQFA